MNTGSPQANAKMQGTGRLEIEIHLIEERDRLMGGWHAEGLPRQAIHSGIFLELQIWGYLCCLAESIQGLAQHFLLRWGSDVPFCRKGG